jgi:hypothetical protein
MTLIIKEFFIAERHGVVLQKHDTCDFSKIIEL